MLMTDDEGAVLFEQDYAPFGQNLYRPGLTEVPTQKAEAGFKYTSQREDVDTGLYYYNARYYDPEVGRFTREDDYQGDLRRPQTLNYYLYVANNPLRFVDPDGHRLVEGYKTPSLVIDTANKLIYSNEEDIDILTAMKMEEWIDVPRFEINYFKNVKAWENIDISKEVNDTLNDMKDLIKDAFGTGYYYQYSTGQIAYLPKEWVEEYGLVPPEYFAGQALSKLYYETNFENVTLGFEYAGAYNLGHIYGEFGLGVHLELDPIEDLKTSSGRKKLLQYTYWEQYFLNQTGVSAHTAHGVDLFMPYVANINMMRLKSVKDIFRIGFGISKGPTVTWNTPKVVDVGGLCYLRGVNFMGWGINYSTSDWSPGTPSAVQVFGGKGIMVDYHQANAWYWVWTTRKIFGFLKC